MSKYDDRLHINLIPSIWLDILNWGRDHMRRYPWRDTSDEYKILIAEILLHRTNADQVKPVYESFINKFPDIQSIADARFDVIISELCSLGLAWRSELLYAMAKKINNEYNGKIPLDKHELMQLPGVGPYIASAVLCFGRALPEPVLDTNTVRVIGRIFGIQVKDSSRRNKIFERYMRDLILQGEPRKFSLALIDFAALICRSLKPKCNFCFLNDRCIFYNTSIQNYQT